MVVVFVGGCGRGFVEVCGRGGRVGGRVYGGGVCSDISSSCSS